MTWLTILITVLDSHEIVRRQMLHFERMGLPEDVELLIIDDGSNPPLSLNGCRLSNARIHATNDFRPWTQQIARNLGAQMAHGTYLLCTDIDHILPEKAIGSVLEGKYDVVRFQRELGALDEDGRFTQDLGELSSYGMPIEGLTARKHLRIRPHGNSYGIRRDLFIALGGSNVNRENLYPQRDEIPLKRKLKRLSASGEVSIIPDRERPTIYMIPNGRYCGDLDANPFGWFHALSRKTPANRAYQEDADAS